MSEEEKIRKIIRLKRYEQPPEGYFDDFLTEFRARRDQSQEKAGATSWLGKVFRKSGDRKSANWILGGGLAYAAFVLALVWLPKGSGPAVDENRQPVIFQPAPDQQKPAPSPKPESGKKEF